MMSCSGGRTATAATFAVSLLYLIYPSCAVTCNMEGKIFDDYLLLIRYITVIITAKYLLLHYIRYLRILEHPMHCV